MSPMRSPVLILRNSGPALRFATACQASKARTGQVSKNVAARQADLGPLPRLVGFAAADAQPQPAGDDGDVLDTQRNQFGAAQRAGEAEQQQRAVAPAARALVAGRQQLAQHGERQRRGLAGRAAVAAQQALQRALDVAMAGVPRQVVEAVHFAQCRQPAADGAGGMAVGQAGEIGADGGRCRRHRDKTVRGAPVRQNASSRPCRRARWPPRWRGRRRPAPRPAPPAPAGVGTPATVVGPVSGGRISPAPASL